MRVPYLFLIVLFSFETYDFLKNPKIYFSKTKLKIRMKGDFKKQFFDIFI